MLCYHEAIKNDAEDFKETVSREFTISRYSDTLFSKIHRHTLKELGKNALKFSSDFL